MPRTPDGMGLVLLPQKDYSMNHKFELIPSIEPRALFHKTLFCVFICLLQ
jgi:hypothetical protein